jgi:hypothetical protein
VEGAVQTGAAGADGAVEAGASGLAGVAEAGASGAVVTCEVGSWGREVQWPPFHRSCKDAFCQCCQFFQPCH